MKQSFTLIELLVVIGIIAILASMLMAALPKAREKARGISCLNNMRNVNIGLQLYADDYNGYAMPAKWGKGADEVAIVNGEVFKGDNLYFYCFNPVINSGSLLTPSQARAKGDAWGKVLLCPSLPDQNEYDADVLKDRPKIGISYNGGLGKNNQYDMGWHRLSEVPSPSKFVSFMDRILQCRLNGSWTVAPYYAQPAQFDDGFGEDVRDPELEQAFRRHGGYINVAFVDGHASTTGTLTIFEECAQNSFRQQDLTLGKYQMNLVPTPPKQE